LGELTALPRPPTGLEAPTFIGKDGKGWEWEGKRKGEDEKRGKEKEGMRTDGGRRWEGATIEMKPPHQNPKYATVCIDLKYAAYQTFVVSSIYVTLYFQHVCPKLHEADGPSLTQPTVYFTLLSAPTILWTET